MKITDQIAAPDRDTPLVDELGRPTDLGSDWSEHVSNRINLDFVGSGTPEAVITADIGSAYKNLSGSTGTTFYVKESGTGNTGWVPYTGTNYTDAYVHFTVTAGTPAIVSQLNVSTITDHGVGQYTANFTSNLATTTYVASGMSENANINAYGLGFTGYPSGRAVGSFRFYTSHYNTGGAAPSYYDPVNVSLLVAGA